MNSGQGVADFARAINKYSSTGRNVTTTSLSVILSELFAAESISPDALRVLTNVRNMVELWTGATPPSPLEAARQWMELYERERNAVPSEVFDALLSKFPKNPKEKIDFGPLVLSLDTTTLVDILLTKGIVSAAALKAIAKAQPEKIYLSPALDSLIGKRSAAPRKVWNEFARGVSRPSSLMTADDALVRSFGADTSGDASKWMVRFLVDNHQIRETILSTILRSPSLASRLAREITLELSASAQKRPNNRLLSLANEWMTICAAIVATDDRNPFAASLVLGMFLLQSKAEPRSMSDETIDRLGDVPVQVFDRALSLEKQPRAEWKDASNYEVVFTATDDDLRRLLHSQIEKLLTPEDANDGSGGILNLDRYLGRKEVIDGLLSALRENLAGAALRDAIEAALFNVGVRAYGEVGQEMLFDFQNHEPEESAILPTDTVIVTAPGRTLGEGPDALMLTRARVKIKTNLPGNRI